MNSNKQITKLEKVNEEKYEALLRMKELEIKVVRMGKYQTSQQNILFVLIQD